MTLNIAEVAEVTEMEPDQIQEVLEVPKDLAGATTLVFAVKALDEKVAEQEETTNRLVEQLVTYGENRIGKLLENRKYLEGLLYGFAEVKLKDKKERSIKTAAGQFGFRKLPDRAAVIEENEFFKWAEEVKEDELIKRIQRPALDKIKKYIRATGEVPPGCEYTLGQDSFFCKTN